MYRKYLIFILLLCFGFHHPNPFAAQHALVVGINEYPQDEDLKGAVNDALLLKDALRRIWVQLPNERVLLNEQATRTNVIRAWRDMVAQATPGDTLIFTYAGHGGQKEDAPPIDEKDDLDETLILYQEEITDDELTELFAQASEYKILFVADSCHSGGLVRSTAKFCRSRFAKRSTSSPRQHNTRGLLRIDSKGDEKERLPHVTFITAVDSDNIKVCESDIEGEAHGALSWFFAKALGEADGDQNKRLERYELDDYLSEKIVDMSGGLQTPKLQPRADSQVVVVLQGQGIPTPTPPTSSNLPQNKIKIKIENGTAPGGLSYVQTVEKGFVLRFVKNGRFTNVYNNVGDKLTTVSSQRTNEWQSLINKERLLQALSTQFDMRLRPIKIELWEGNGLHKRGEILNFNITPADSNARLNALTLFNLPGNGELQFLYPLKRRNHSPTIQQFPYFLPPIGVRSPFGGDNLVAILCTHPPTRLHQLLANNAPFIPEPAQIISTLHDQRCQVGQKAFFTGE